MSTDHTPYCLFLSEAEWHALPDKLRDPYFAAIAATNLKALHLLGTTHGATMLDLPGTLGSTDEQPEFRWRVLKNRLVRAVVAWYLTHEQPHLDFALATLDFFIASGVGTTRFAHARCHRADLKTGDEMYKVAFALDTLAPYMGAERCARLRALAAAMLEAYLAGIDEKEWWRHAEFNWGTAVHGNAGLAALAIRPWQPALAAEALGRARAGVQYAIDAMPPGGGWTEGIMYMATMLAHLTDFVAALHRVDGDDLGLSAHRNVQDLLTSRIYLLGGDGLPINFSNCNETSAEWVLPHAYWWAQRCQRPDWTWFEDQHVKPWRDVHGLFHDVEAFWYRPAFPATHQPASVRSLYLSGLDWYVWHGERTWCALRGGCNGGNHNNRDLGHFIFGAGPDRFLIDPGYGAAAASQHNVFTLRGKDQVDCAQAPIFRHREHPGGFYLACDLTAAYTWCAAYCYRHVLLIDETHLLVIDDILGRAGKRNGATFHWHTRFPHELLDHGVRLQGTQAALTVRMLEPIHRINTEQWTWRGLPITSFSWHEAWDHVHSVHPVLFSLSDEPFTYERGPDTFTLRIRGAAYELDLAEATLTVRHD